MKKVFLCAAVAMLVSFAAQAQKSWLFDTAGNAEGWTAAAQVSGFGVSGGSLNFTCAGGDPQVQSPDFIGAPLVGSTNPWLKLDLESSVTGDYQLFFIRTDRGISEEDSIFFRVQAGRALYQIHMPRRLGDQGKNGTDLWTNRSIRQFRFDPPGGTGTVKIHSFIVENHPHPDWPFNLLPGGIGGGHASGWYPQNVITNFQVTAAGTVSMNVTGSDPFFGVDPLAFDPNAFKYLYIRQSHTGFASGNAASSQTFAFPGTGGTGFVNKDWRHYPNNGAATIVLDMTTGTTNASWAGAYGSISQVRIDPSTEANAATYVYDHIALRTAGDFSSAAVQWPAMAGPGAWVAAKHDTYAGSQVALAGGAATLTQTAGGQPMAMLNQDFVVNAANRYLYLDVAANTTAPRMLTFYAGWAVDGKEFTAGGTARQYAGRIATNAGANRYVVDLGAAQASPFNGAWSGLPHGLMLRFGDGEADLSSVVVTNVGLLAAAPPEIAMVDTESATNADAYAKTMALNAGTGVAWSLSGQPSGMTINASTGAISWPTPVYNASAYTITVTATNAQGTDTEVFALSVADAVAPANPSLSSTSHSVGGTLAASQIVMQWTGASDGATGVNGYSFVFSGDPGAAVDTTADLAHSADPHTVTSAALADGAWYFRLRTRDGAGNWSTPVTWGPTTIDTTAPVVTLTGASTVTLECGVDSYSELGAAWTDNILGAGAVTNISGAVGTAVGDYFVTYTFTDNAGNADSKTRTVSVVDTAVPVVTIDGGVSALGGECGVALALPGATAADVCDGALTASVSDYDGLNEAAPAAGVYDVVYSATDGEGNTGTATLTVTVDDTTAPLVTIGGGISTLSGECGTGLALPGATATDTCEGPLAALVTDDDGLNTAAPASGVYDVVYSATDAEGNTGTATLTVTIEDTLAPVVTIDGGVSALSGECGVALTLPGATAADDCDGAPAASVSDYDGLNPAAPAAGVYDVVYAAADAAGNTGTATLTVTVDDTASPVVTIDGGVSTLSGECGVALTLPGASAADDCDGAPAASVSDYDGLNPAAPAAGVYDVVYAAADAAGNTGTATLTVTVDDTTAPVVTLDGGVSTLSGECGVALTLPGATAADDCDGAFAASVSDYDGLNPAAPAVGVYDVVYAATDTAGNTGTATLTVTVDDTAAPVVTIPGANPAYVVRGTSYTAPAASAFDACDGDLGAVTGSGAVDTSTLGAYDVTYTAQDAAGNPAVETLTVNVTD
ncbi:MAG TPA: DUF5011 domain-containing protein, partial [Candidatus Hydrogenedentes bacterium]|nr:DUF5011 domain-containing protein [Candidatus Hydrogenedentota bacterium]